MRKGLFILIAVCSLIISYAQTVTFNWGETGDRPAIYVPRDIQFLSEQNGYYYYIAEEAFKFKDQEFQIYAFDAKMALIGVLPVEYPSLTNGIPDGYDKKAVLNGSINFNGDGYLIFNAHKPKENKAVTILTRITANGAELSFEHQAIAETGFTSKTDVTASLNNEYLMVSCIKYQKKESEALAEVHIFDKDLNELWAKTFTPKGYKSVMYYDLPFNEIKHHSWNMANDGSVSLIYIKRDGGFDEKWDTDNNIRQHFSYSIISITDNGSKLISLEPSAGSYNIGVLEATSFNGELVFGGSIFDLNRKKGDAGVIFFTMNQTGQQENTTITKFEDFTDADKDTWEGEQVFTKVDFKQKEGTLFLVLEKCFVVSVDGGNGNVSTYGGLLIQNYSTDFKVKWSTYVNKYQRWANDNGLLGSYMFLVDKSLNPILIYTPLGGTNKVNNWYGDKTQDKQLMTYQLSFDSTGKYVKKELFEINKQNPYLVPKTLQFLGEGRYIFLSEDKKKIKLGSITVE